MNTIKQFCEERKLSKPIEDAFIMYCRSTYAERFMLKDGDTVQAIIARMNQEQVEDAWGKFVTELRNVASDS